MELGNAILATVVYYNRFEFPLTSFEIWRFLINPKRLGQENRRAVDLSETLIEIDNLVAAGNLAQKFGFYFLNGREEIVRTRLEREKIAARKWKKFIRLAWWFQLAPWIEGMFASGSLALNNTTEASDFDVLIVAKSSRLYLARLILSGLASLLGARRTRYQTSAPDKFCFNHYITDEHLGIEHQSLYNAQTYTHLVPVFGRKSLWEDFMVANQWFADYLNRPEIHFDFIRRQPTESMFLRNIARVFEFFLDNWFGDLLEKFSKRYQQKRIAANPATYAAGGRIIYNDHELEFHPRSFEKEVLDTYNFAIKKLGVSIKEELDSGLKKAIDS